MTDESRQRLVDSLKVAEGTGPVQRDRLMPYSDSLGVLTIGYGRAIGRIGISFGEAETLLRHDIDRSERDLDFAAAWWRSLDDVRQRALVEMIFQLGLGTFLDFHHTRDALQHQRFGLAADAMLDSEWADQTPARVQRLAAMVRTGLDIV